MLEKGDDTMKKTVFLVDIYSQSPQVSIRPLQNALEARGYDVKIILMKKFRYSLPERISDTEIDLLIDLIKKEQPLLVGVTMLTSYYYEMYKLLTDRIKEAKDINVTMVGGGVFASLSPEKCLDFSDYVVRGEGEEPICELADALYSNQDIKDIKNLAYKNENGEVVLNPLRPLITEIDKYGPPRMNSGCEYLIDHDKLIKTDPQTGEFAYSINASRGCYFSCAFCGSSTMREMSKGCGGYVRLRDVNHVIDELAEAMQKMKNLVYVRFVDAVFPTKPAWIDEFCRLYKEKINLPFKIWTHPHTTNHEALKKLRKIGLHKVIMGIQSGSPTIRNDIYKRNETQETIIEASRIYKECKIPYVEYDIILCPDFETEETIRESYELCMSLIGDFSLSINELKYLPETEIVNIALERGVITKEEVEASFFAPLEKQYEYMKLAEHPVPYINFWYKMIFISQFKGRHRALRKIASNPKKYIKKLERNFKFASFLMKMRRYRFLLASVLLGMRVRLFVR